MAKSCGVTEFFYLVFIMCTISTFRLAAVARVQYFPSSVRTIYASTFLMCSCAHDCADERMSVRCETWDIITQAQNISSRTSKSRLQMRRYFRFEPGYGVRIPYGWKRSERFQYLLFKCDWTLSRTRYAICHHEMKQRNSMGASCVSIFMQMWKISLLLLRISRVPIWSTQWMNPNFCLNRFFRVDCHLLNTLLATPIFSTLIVQMQRNCEKPNQHFPAHPVAPFLSGKE